MGMASVYAAVSLIAEQIGQLPLKVYRKTDGERVEADTKLLADVARPANPVTTAHNFGPPSQPTSCCTAMRLWRRTATRSPGVQSLWLQDPNRITVEFNGRRKRYVDEGRPAGRGRKNKCSTSWASP